MRIRTRRATSRPLKRVSRVWRNASERWLLAATFGSRCIASILPFVVAMRTRNGRGNADDGDDSASDSGGDAFRLPSKMRGHNTAVADFWHVRAALAHRMELLIDVRDVHASAVDMASRVFATTSAATLPTSAAAAHSPSTSTTSSLMTSSTRELGRSLFAGVCDSYSPYFVLSGSVAFRIVFVTLLLRCSRGQFGAERRRPRRDPRGRAAAPSATAVVFERLHCHRHCRPLAERLEQLAARLRLVVGAQFPNHRRHSAFLGSAIRDASACLCAARSVRRIASISRSKCARSLWLRKTCRSRASFRAAHAAAF